MVEWCDDERNTRATYHSTTVEKPFHRESAADVARDIALSERKQKHAMNFNETVFFDPTYEKYAMQNGLPVQLQIDPPTLPAEKQDRREQEQEQDQPEQNAALMDCNKFYDS